MTPPAELVAATAKGNTPVVTALRPASASAVVARVLIPITPAKNVLTFLCGSLTRIAVPNEDFRMQSIVPIDGLIGLVYTAGAFGSEQAGHCACHAASVDGRVFGSRSS